MLQFHGNESIQFCHKFKGYKIIKAFRIKDKLDLKNVLRYKTFAYLFDNFEKIKIGGTGKKFNWNLLANRDKIKRILFLSGGLKKKNVKEAIKIVHPDWLDVSSSVELRPGKKDYKKIKEFIEVVRNIAL
jgi:phosphoribosylanthranilate isomerase